MTRDELLEQFEVWFQDNAQYPAAKSLMQLGYEAGFNAAVVWFEQDEADEWNLYFQRDEGCVH